MGHGICFLLSGNFRFSLFFYMIIYFRFCDKVVVVNYIFIHMKY